MLDKIDKAEKIKHLYVLLEQAEKKGDDVKWNLIAQEIAALEEAMK